MVNEELECNLLVIPCTICKKIWGKPRVFAMDCEIHEVCEHDTLFAGAIGRAMLHRGAAIR